MSLQDDQSRISKAAQLIEEAKGELSALVGKEGTGAAINAATSSPLPFHQHYKIFRDYIEHEDSLIDKRLLWNINIQGFLFATYGFSVQKLAAEAKPDSTGTAALGWLIVALPILGITISVYSLKGVRAAQLAIRELSRCWEEQARRQHEGEPPRILSELPILPGIIGGGHNDKQTLVQQKAQNVTRHRPSLKGWVKTLKDWRETRRIKKAAHDAHTEGFSAPKMFPKVFIAAWLVLLASYGCSWLYYLLRSKC